jgi:hypothetical protein
MEPACGEVTGLLGELRRGSPEAEAKLVSLVYEHFHPPAAQPEMNWQDRAHFFGVAARLMR